MKKLVLVFIVSFSFICLWGLIESNPSGGTWNDGNSWIGGLVPSPEDDVLITSNIVINVDASCHNFTISSSGLIQNSYGDHRQFTINGNLSNAGFIKNNPNGYYLFVYVKGNVENSGFILNYELAFLGEEAQYFTNSGSLSPAYLIDNYPNSSVILLSDISTNNTIIDFNNDRLVLNSASGTFNLSMSGGYMIDTILEGGNGATLSMTGGCYLENSYADEIVFNGTIIIKDNVVIDYLINQATVYNYFGDNRTFTINQRLDNYGIICNNPTAYLLFVNIAGDVNNYGTIRSNKIYLTGAAQHKLYQSDSYHSFNCNNFIVSGEGSTKALSNIYFLNCEINLNNTTMILHNEDNSYGLYLNGGKLTYANLDGGTESVLKLENNAYLSNVTMDDFIWQGTVIIENNVSINNLINQATVYNYSGNHRTLTINQRLDNYGTICNSPNTHWIFLTIAGDLYNYSSIFNYQITMNGTQDQHFQHMADSSINVNYFTLVSDVGAAFWYYNNSLTPYNSSPTNSININPTQYGTWQPRNPETGESGRHIIISTGEAHIDTPTAFTIYTDNGIPKLRWNKVSNALFYHLFVSTTPEGLSTVTPITIYDTDLSDNIVTVDLEGVEPIQFYRVTAGY